MSCTVVIYSSVATCWYPYRSLTQRIEGGTRARCCRQRAHVLTSRGSHHGSVAEVGKSRVWLPSGVVALTHRGSHLAQVVSIISRQRSKPLFKVYWKCEEIAENLPNSIWDTRGQSYLSSLLCWESQVLVYIFAARLRPSRFSLLPEASSGL